MPRQPGFAGRIIAGPVLRKNEGPRYVGLIRIALPGLTCAKLGPL